LSSQPLAEIVAERGPWHVAIIMDGNGRWARARGQPRTAGHRAGARAVRRITQAAAEIGIRQLTLYAFSSENWARPPAEVAALMRLFRRYLRSERAELARSGIRLRIIGRMADLPAEVVREAQRAVHATAHCTAMTLCLAINYGARGEIADACRALASDAARGVLSPADIDEDAVASRLYQPDMPRLDLVIRTGGDQRLSNFLLWQTAYAELFFTPVAWPAFGADHLADAIRSFHRRERRYGRLPRLGLAAV